MSATNLTIARKIANISEPLTEDRSCDPRSTAVNESFTKLLVLNRKNQDILNQNRAALGEFLQTFLWTYNEVCKCLNCVAEKTNRPELPLHDDRH